MKVIDILNKIANGEEVPKKIKYNRKVYEYQEESYDYTINNEKFLMTEVFDNYDNVLSILNYNVEIIEEDKKIEKIKKVVCYSDLIDRNEFVVEYLAELKYKINEIIDYLNRENK